MHTPGRVAALVALLAVFSSCSDTGPVGPAGSALSLAIAAGPVVRVSEIHYDNAGTDTGEAIEVSGPAGTDLAGWRLVLYNGSGGASYNTRVLSGTIAESCDGRGVVVFGYPQDGIQNGSPDGIALVDPGGAVLEFLSYEGSFTAVGGLAGGAASVDIGVTEPGTTPIGHSVKRTSGGTWEAPSENDFSVCNDAGDPPPPPPPADLPATRFSEIHYDNVDVDEGEAIEIEGPGGTDLTGWSVVLYNGSGGTVYDTRQLSGTIVTACEARGVVALEYPSNGIQNGSPDGMALVNAAGAVVEFLSYEGAFAAVDGPAAGRTSVDIGVSEGASTLAGQSLRRLSNGTWRAPGPTESATFGACNGDGAPPPLGNRISFSGRLAGDPPLPVGFQDQLFATVRGPTNEVIPAAIVWSSETPNIASIDHDGVMTALAAGTAVVRATAEGLATQTFSLPTLLGVAAPGAVYAGNAEFGEPADGNGADDFIVRYPQFTASFNPTRGTPNWVSYDLEATHFGAEDRCDCFTFDPELPAVFTRYTTADYTGAGAFHGYAIDRGHLARSADRTAGSLDNARTFYFTNIIPQAADLNQGPWAILENELGDRARSGVSEVYVVTGVAGSKGTVKDEGTITIPAAVWKVALILPRDHGLAALDDFDDLAGVEVIAVVMPNDPGVRNVDWRTYRTTVDQVESISGYDLLALLPDPIETALESATRPPVAATDGPYALAEGATITMSGAASTDPDGDELTYAWSFGDGGAATGAIVSHRYAQDGVYAVTLTVTDSRDLSRTTTTMAVVSNVAPAIDALPGAMLFPGELYSAAGRFADPGADVWTAAVDYGDGSGAGALPLNGTGFSLAHTYGAAGSFTVAVRVSDDDASSVAVATVTVRSASEGVTDAIALIEELVAARKLPAAHARALTVQLDVAGRQLDRGFELPAAALLGAVIREIDALVLARRLDAGDVEPLGTLLRRVQRSVSR